MPDSLKAFLSRQVAVCGLAAAAMAGPAMAADRIDTQDFSVIDGDTLEAGDISVTLAGIDAPELGWPCTLQGTSRDCGVVARSSLLDLTAGARLVCDPVGDHAYRCTANGYDISEGMVYTGWAVPLPDAPGRYHAVLEDARSRQRGFWRGSFTETYPALDLVLQDD